MIGIIYHTEDYTDNNENDNKKAAVFCGGFFILQEITP